MPNEELRFAVTVNMDGSKTHPRKYGVLAGSDGDRRDRLEMKNSINLELV